MPPASSTVSLFLNVWAWHFKNIYIYAEQPWECSFEAHIDALNIPEGNQAPQRPDFGAGAEAVSGFKQVLPVHKGDR